MHTWLNKRTIFFLKFAKARFF